MHACAEALESQVETLILNGKHKDEEIMRLKDQQSGITQKADALEKLLKRVEELEKRLGA
jgi:hypothetical protein